ncbi:hypothetical protein HYC85_023360 [Camellia sinensis]|uniref:PGG domain-containing protein n=1 Tax=Camellia sinensis TaxID=4442 RepID=A0A7J7GGR1_CAMSI|nr:hypothetical protein HYC85_023360 [Camellia sinensis]
MQFDSSAIMHRDAWHEDRGLHSLKEIEEISIRDKNWEKNTPQFWIRETLIIATKNGITEIVDSILKEFPMDIDDKNIIFRLAIESRQPHVYKLLLENRDMRNSIFRAVDNDGNTALHLAAKLGDRSWIIPGSKMQWEIKWYQV